MPIDEEIVLPDYVPDPPIVVPVVVPTPEATEDVEETQEEILTGEKEICNRLDKLSTEIKQQNQNLLTRVDQLETEVKSGREEIRTLRSLQVTNPLTRTESNEPNPNPAERDADGLPAVETELPESEAPEPVRPPKKRRKI